MLENNNLPMISRQVLRSHFSRIAALVVAVVCLVGVPSSAMSEDSVGSVHSLQGSATAVRNELARDLSVRSGVFLNDLITTRTSSKMAINIGPQTRVFLGEDTELVIDEFILEAGGVLDFSRGAFGFDRPETATPMPMEIRTKFGRIGVRGTRFFAGRSNGVFSVFVDRGRIEVTAGGVSRPLTAGQGVDIPAPGQPPSQVKNWGEKRINEALQSVGMR